MWVRSQSSVFSFCWKAALLNSSSLLVGKRGLTALQQLSLDKPDNQFSPKSYFWPSNLYILLLLKRSKSNRICFLSSPTWILPMEICVINRMYSHSHCMGVSMKLEAERIPVKYVTYLNKFRMERILFIVISEPLIWR